MNLVIRAAKHRKFHELFWGALQGAQIQFFYWFSYGAYAFWAPCKAPKSAREIC